MFILRFCWVNLLYNWWHNRDDIYQKAWGCGNSSLELRDLIIFRMSEINKMWSRMRLHSYVTAKHLVHEMDKVKTRFIDNRTKWRFFFCEAEICKHIITCINTVLLFCSGEKDCFYKHVNLIVCMFFTPSVYTHFWIKHYMTQVTWSNCMCLGASIFNL